MINHVFVFLWECHSFINGHSFTYAYGKPTRKAIEMWRRVLHEVETGGWDQDQYGYWATKMATEEGLRMVDMRWGVKRLENNDFDGILKAREKDLTRR